MNRLASIWFALALLRIPVFAATPEPANSYPGWKHSGFLMIVTTSSGANLQTGVTLTDFPLLVRLNRDWFDFAQAKAGGEDIRFSSSRGVALPYQIEEWDVTQGRASIWVRIPRIQGNELQEIRLHWGKADADSEPNGSAVFNESNGYRSVWHMNGPVKDEVGTIHSRDAGTTPTQGIIGPARHLAEGQGIFGGEKITNYPVGSSPHSSEIWFRPERSNGSALAWGNEQGQGKVVMQFRSPPHIRMDCYFSSADVASSGRMPMNEWSHVVHTYQPGDSRIYINGVLSGVSTRTDSPLALKSPSRLWIGGWYHHYDFVGDIDETRVSRVVRSADWVKMQYENQKLHPTLVGLVVPAGMKSYRAFVVSPEKATVSENGNVTFTAQANGAHKIYWSLLRDGTETIVAVDRLRFQFEAGRVSGDTSATLRVKALFADQVRTQDISITIQEDIAEPIFTLKAPRVWDGREIIEIVPEVRNLGTMAAKGAGDLKTDWNAGPFAVIKAVAPGKLVLRRAQRSGTLTVRATMSNGGKPVTQSTTIEVTEPKRDAWEARIPGPKERPEDGQFFARDDQDEGTLFYNGTLAKIADSVFLKLYADDQFIRTEAAKPAPDGSYRLQVKLKAGLRKYAVEFGTKTGGQETVHHTATNLVCGDAYLIDGQSNALATDTHEKSPPETNEWIRSYGNAPDSGKTPQGNLWCNPVWKAEKGEQAELGWWGMELAKRLVKSREVPIFIINAAAGGTRIDQHQRNPTHPTDLSTLYGRMLWRVRQAKLTHGIRGILWHQGENDQGADGPTGGYGWETYQANFMEMAGGWKQDFPNVRHYYIFQIWPDSCAMGGREGSGDRLREKQRTLPELFSNMSILSTLGVQPPGGCHFPLAGWSEFARMVEPLINRDLPGAQPAGVLTAPNLRTAKISTARDTIEIEFDQPVVWADKLATQFYLDDAKGKIASGSANGSVLRLVLKQPTEASAITYLKESAWNQNNLLRGTNGHAALTFCNVPLAR